MFSIFKRKPKSRMVIIDRASEQEALALERSVRLRAEQIAALDELGGFDTWLEDSDQNWTRQAQLLVEFKRSIADLTQRVATLEGGK